MNKDLLKIFNRPSREQLRAVNEEIASFEEIKEIMNERAQALNEEISRLDKIINKNSETIIKLRANLLLKLDKCVKTYGLLNLKRLSISCRESLKVDLHEESVLGVKYQIPLLKKTGNYSYSINRSNELVDQAVLHNMELLQALLNFSKYYEARKKLSRELNSIQRRLNSIKNLLIKELLDERKKISNFLSEKERFEWVINHKTISLAREQELFK